LAQLGSNARSMSQVAGFRALSQSAFALLDVKASKLAVKVHQNCDWPRLDLASSTWHQLGHLGFMLHACRAWLHRQLSLLVSRQALSVLISVVDHTGTQRRTPQQRPRSGRALSTRGASSRPTPARLLTGHCRGRVKGGRRPRCRGSKSKKFCKKRRKLRGPTPKLGFGTDATRRTQCERCDRGQHTKCRRLRTCFARSPPGVNRREIARRSKRDAKKATATAQLEATTQVMVNLSLNPTGGPNGSTASFLQLTELALAAASVLLADTDDEEGEDEGEDEGDDAHYPPDAAPGPSGGRREEEDGSGGPGGGGLGLGGLELAVF